MSLALITLHSRIPAPLSCLYPSLTSLTEEESVKAAASKVKQQFSQSDNHLRLAFAIPGILHPEKSPAQIDYDLALQTFKINTLGPMLLMKHFCAFLPRKASHALSSQPGLPDRAVWGTMAARLGSTTTNAKGGWYSYRASKAGVVSLAKTFDLYLQGVSGEHAVSVALHPGTVKTNLSKDFWDTVEGGKLFAPELAAEQLCDVVKGAKMDERGLFLDWAGKVIQP